MPMTTALLRRDEVMRRLGVRRTKFASMVATGELPKPVIVCGSVRAWREDDITAFIESRPVDESFPRNRRGGVDADHA
jgi:predicted DNA-binding transcriptional regulator AlpA